MYHTQAAFHAEPLPFETYIPENADKIILGTFPTKENLRKYNFFYPNPGNKFWKILAGLTGHQLIHMEGDQAVNERKWVLDQLKLAISDMGHVIYRQNESSLDANIFPVEFTDIFRIIDENPAIRTIIITSSTKGSSVLSWFAAYCQLNAVVIRKPDNSRVPWETTITFNDKMVRVIVVYSTSGAAMIKEDDLSEMYGNAILRNSALSYL